MRFAEFEGDGFGLGDGCLVFRSIEHDVDGFGDARHVGFVHAPAGNGGCTEADTAGLEGTAGFTGYGVFVGCDIGLVESVLGDLSGQVGVVRTQVDHHQVVIGTTADDVMTALAKGGCECLGIGCDLSLVSLRTYTHGELRSRSL